MSRILFHKLRRRVVFKSASNADATKAGINANSNVDGKASRAWSRSRAQSRIGWGVATWTIALLAAMPLMAVLYALFLPSGGWAHIASTNLQTYLTNTVILMMCVGLISTLIGVSTAWAVTTTVFPGRRILSWMLILPLASPAYIMAYLYTDILSVSGPVQTLMRQGLNIEGARAVLPPIRSLPGAALMLSLVLYPYIYVLARTSFSAQSRSEFQAGRMLGLSPFGAFWRIALPGARPAIAGGLALVLMETLADFGVADYFAVPTFSTGIFRTWLAMGDRIAALKLAAVMLVLVIALVIFEARSRRGHVQSKDGLSRSDPLFPLPGFQGWMVMMACALPVLLGFFIPIGWLVYYALTEGDSQGVSAVIGFARNSLVVAMCASVICILSAFGLAFQKRRASGPITRYGIQLATLGYALPGALLAVGIMVPMGLVDQDITRFLSQYFGYEGSLILTGTIAALVYAMVVRFMTVGFNAVDSAMEKIPLHLEQAAKSLGASPFGIVRRIYVPLMAPGLATGLMLVIIDVIRELPATLILRPFNFDTLATRVYWLASDERLGEASTAAVLIVATGLIPVLWLNRIKA